LDPKTLQQARLFGCEGEILIWRMENELTARRLLEGQGDETGYLDVEQLLWGDRVEKPLDDFVLLREGEQGLRHAPPIKVAGNPGPEACLIVRNYLAYEEDTGQAYVSLSRLVDLR
jgi:CRISPR-associated protein (TIGR03984 family)